MGLILTHNSALLCHTASTRPCDVKQQFQKALFKFANLKSILIGPYSQI